MAKMIDCPYCGKLTDPNLSNCPHCGGSLAHKTSVPKRVNLGKGRQTCPTCKALVQDGDIICVACGTNLLTGQKVVHEQAAPAEQRQWNLPSPRTIAIAVGALVVVGLLALWTLYMTRDPKSQAARLIEEGSYIEAEEILDAYVSVAPDDSDARMTLGQLQFRNNRYSAAASSFEEALRLHPTDARAAYWALASHIRSGGDQDYSRRMGLLNQLVELDASDARAWYLLSVTRGATGDDEGARQALEQFRNAGGSEETFKWNQAIALAQTGQLVEAADALSGAAEGSRAADAKAAQAMISAMRGQLAEAQAALLEVVDEPDLTVNWEVQTELGKIYLARGEFQRAVQSLDAALAANAGNPAAHYFRGLAYAAMNRDQQATQDLEFLLSTGRDYAHAAALELARLALRARDSGRAQEYLNRADRIDAKVTPDYLVLLGRTALGQNNFRDAERSFDRAIEMNKNFAEAYLERGLLHIQRDRIEPGIADLQRYVQLIHADTAGTAVVEIRELISQLKSSGGTPGGTAVSMQGARE